MANGNQGKLSQFSTGGLMGMLGTLVYLGTKAFMPESLGSLSPEESTTFRETGSLFVSGLIVGIVRLAMARWVVPNVKASVTSLVALFTTVGVVGCAGASIRYQPVASEPPVLEVDPSILGRGAMVVNLRRGDDSVEVIVCQDGTSDWSVSRVVALLGEVVGYVFGANDPGSMAGPDPARGCAALYGNATVEVEPNEFPPPPGDET